MASRYLRPRIVVGHVVILLAVLTCLRLGWWQWNVSQRPGGTAQNLGYAVLWPVFAVCFVYMWLRLLQLGDVAARDESAPDQQEAPCATAPERKQVPAAMTVGVGYIREAYDDDQSVSAEDAELAAYNRALAQLAQEDHGTVH